MAKNKLDQAKDAGHVMLIQDIKKRPDDVAKEEPRPIKFQIAISKR
jgi:hypothetical protein